VIASQLGFGFFFSKVLGEINPKKKKFIFYLQNFPSCALFTIRADELAGCTLCTAIDHEGLDSRKLVVKTKPMLNRSETGVDAGNSSNRAPSHKRSPLF